MKKLIITGISFLIIMILCGNCGIMKKGTSQEAFRSNKTILELYGEEIYKRESCNNCHTQHIEEENINLGSLDGVGGKYPNSWLYEYLFDPQIMKYQSKMPAYPNLHIKPLDEKILIRIMKEKKLKINKEKLWRDLNEEAEILLVKLNSQARINLNENTEILALIAYIQQIPYSKNKIIFDKTENSKRLDKEKAWDNILLDTNTIILKIANNDNYINEGKSIFINNCSPCHGQQGGGIVGPNLTDDYWLHGGNKIDIAKTIIYGVPDKGMISWKNQLSPNDVGALIAYIYSIRGTNPENSKAPQGKKD